MAQLAHGRNLYPRQGDWYYRYRAMDTSGQAIDFLLTAHRDEPVAKCFFTKAIHRHGEPEKVTIDGSEANAAAIRNDHVASGTALVIRQVKYLHNILEQDYRGVQQMARSRLEGKSCAAAQGRQAASEFMHLMQKRQRVVKAGAVDCTAAEQFYALAA
jgi:putative transposase